MPPATTVWVAFEASPRITIWKLVYQHIMVESFASYALTLKTTSCALPFFIGLCNVSIVEISPKRHLKGRLRTGAEFLVDHRNKEGQEDGSPLTSKVQAITERENSLCCTSVQVQTNALQSEVPSFYIPNMSNGNLRNLSAALRLTSGPIRAVCKSTKVAPNLFGNRVSCPEQL